MPSTKVFVLEHGDPAAPTPLPPVTRGREVREHRRPLVVVEEDLGDVRGHERGLGPVVGEVGRRAPDPPDEGAAGLRCGERDRGGQRPGAAAEVDDARARTRRDDAEEVLEVVDAHDASSSPPARCA